MLLINKLFSRRKKLPHDFKVYNDNTINPYHGNKSQVVPSANDLFMRAKNAAISGSSGIGSNCDQAYDLQVQFDQPLNLTEQLRISEILYYTDPFGKKIVNIPVGDMLRKDWEYDGLTKEQVKDLENYHSRLNLHQALREALRLERLHGGSAIYIGVRGDIDDPSLPISELDVQKDSVLFLHPLSRQRVSTIIFHNNPLDPSYGHPEFYFIQGFKVHRSRLLIFDGDPVLPVPTGASSVSSFFSINGFGTPILMSLYNSLLQSTGSRQAAFHLLQRASIMIFSGDIQSQAATAQGIKALDVLRNTLESMSSFKAALFQKNAGESGMAVSNLAANFGSVPELIMIYLQVLSAASDIPATRFLGEAPGGLNATGKSDLENYYNMINAIQRHRLEPQLKKLLRLTLPSAGIPIDSKDVAIEFPPLWNESATEQATVRQVDTSNITSMVSQGLISDEEALEEARRREVLLTDPDEFPPPEKIDVTEDINIQDQLGKLRDL